MKAFRDAMQLGADGIELDVRRCRSGEVVVFHDSRLDRMTNGNGLLKNTPLAGLKTLRIVHQGRETEEQIPTLEEVLDLVRDKMLVNIEIKANGLPTRNNLEEKVLQICGRFGLEYKVILSSFNPLTVRKVRKLDEQVLNGFIIDKNFNIGNTELLLGKVARARAIHMESSLLTAALARKISRRGLYCLVWTVNAREAMRRFVQLGVNGIITDKPDVLDSIIREVAND